MSQPYRPSNGTEGVAFIERFCGRCARDVNHDCPILAATFAFDIGEDDYPREWIQDDAGARCTAFVPEGEPIPTEPDPRQQDLPL